MVGEKVFITPEIKSPSPENSNDTYLETRAKRKLRNRFTINNSKSSIYTGWLKKICTLLLLSIDIKVYKFS